MGGVAQRTYLPGLGEAYPAGATPMADYAYYTPDHLGSVRGIRLPDRSLSGSYTYEPYGQTRAASGLPLNVGYTGHLWDATIQQYFAPFRYYNPAAARWTMRDPLGLLDSFNSYSYVGSNPYSYHDRLGLQRCRSYDISKIWSYVFDPYFHGGPHVDIKKYGTPIARISCKTGKAISGSPGKVPGWVLEKIRLAGHVARIVSVFLAVLQGIGEMCIFVDHLDAGTIDPPAGYEWSRDGGLVSIDGPYTDHGDSVFQHCDLGMRKV